MLSDIEPLDTLLDPFFRKIAVRDHLGAEERAALLEACDQNLRFTAGQNLVTEGSRPTHSMLVVRGFTCRYRVVAEGERQLTAIHLSGDFVDLHSFLLKEMDHSVGALTDCTVLTFPHERLVRLTERFPHLTRLLWLLTLLDGAIHREWLVGMGRLSASQRAAHLFCELYARLHALGLADGHAFHLPIAQTALADAIGVSAVHVNRVIQELRRAGLINWDGGLLRILDWAGLVKAGEFDDIYLHLVREPR